MTQTVQKRSWWSRITNTRAISLLALMIVASGWAGLMLVSGTETAKGGPKYTNFKKLGCYVSPTDGKIWVAMTVLNQDYLPDKFAYDNDLHIILKTGDSQFDIDNEDIITNPLSNFNFAGAQKYKFMKYSLLVDYSASIDNNLRGVLATLYDFTKRLPLAIEGQVIRFSDNVEPPMAFTTDKNEILNELGKVPERGGTALHDALMKALAEQGTKGSDVPLRVIVVFTDGVDTGSQTYVERDNFIQSFTNIAKRLKVIVIAVGVTSEVDEDLLKQITRADGITGQYIHVSDFTQLRSAFKLIEQQIQNTIVFRIPKLGPTKGHMNVYFVTRSMGGTPTTIQDVQCNFQ